MECCEGVFAEKFWSDWRKVVGERSLSTCCRHILVGLLERFRVRRVGRA